MAIADANNLVSLTTLALGDGHVDLGANDGARITLRNERRRLGRRWLHRSLFRASFAGSAGEAAWGAREAGLIARIGGGQEYLAIASSAADVNTGRRGPAGVGIVGCGSQRRAARVRV